MRNLLLCAAALVFGLPFVPASAQEPITTPILSTAENFRDIAGLSTSNGGTGLAETTSHNGAMRTGVFYRSDALNSLNYADWTTLSSLNIRHDIDLRTPSEISGASDWVPNGATWTNVNIYGMQAPPPTNMVTDLGKANQYMLDTYQAFVLDPVQRTMLRTVLVDLANSSGPVVYHCSAGKDRTGWTSALLQSIAGVSQANIQQDYMATNKYAAGDILKAQADLVSQGLGYLIPITVVDPTYLQSALDQVTASYGSMNAYLTEGLGLTQADIYVLRAKMVYYATLPGQSGFVGNAAAGAALLNSLQNSPLSGNYTAYNYYLQSAIDAGTLGGVETQVGGQVYADAAAYLLRQPLWLDWAIAPQTIGGDLGVGQKRFWVVGLGGYCDTNGRAGVAGSTEGSGGSVVGATYRLGEQVSADLGVGYTSGWVGSAGASAEVHSVPVTFGARYGFSALEEGPYVAARADLGWADCGASRALGGGLGTALGRTTGTVYSGRFDLGDVIRWAPVTITPQTGFRITQATLGGVTESGSDLALDVDGITHTIPSFLADLEIALDPRPWRGWTVTPSLDLGYELALSNPQVESTGELYGYTVSQYSAFESWYLLKVGLAVTAQRGAFTVTAGANGLFSDGTTTAIIPQLSVAYGF